MACKTNSILKDIMPILPMELHSWVRSSRINGASTKTWLGGPKTTASRRRRLSSWFGAMLTLLAATAQADDHFIAINPSILAPPDPCAPTLLSLAPVESTNLDLPGPSTLIAYRRANAGSESGFLSRRSPSPVVLFINGNGYGHPRYRAFAEFMARQGFIAAVLHRGTPTTAETVVQSLDAVFGAFDLASDTPVGLIGHSVGGGLAVDGAIFNASEANYDIRAIASLAPHIAGAGKLTGAHVEAYALVYGSQDEDVDGITGGIPNEAFAAYDRAGTEASTTCASPPCLSPPNGHLERFLAYIHGAGHPGLVNVPFCPGIQGQCLAQTAYLSTADQFCIAKGFSNALMQWKLRGNVQYRRVLTGQHLPASMLAIKTNDQDFKDNPAGADLRMVIQYSPAARRRIQNFENWSNAQFFGNTTDVEAQVVQPGELATSGPMLRQDTHLMLVTWPQRAEMQWIGFNVPNDSMNISSYSHLALRIGHVRNSGGTEPPNASQDLMLCIRDNAHNLCRTIGNALPPVDLRPAQGDGDSLVGLPALRTIAVPFSSFIGFSDFNKQAAQTIFVVFPAGTQGTVAIDSIEWFRN